MQISTTELRAMLALLFPCIYMKIYLAQILDVNPEDEAEEDGANVDLDSQRKGKCVVLKTSTRQVSFSAQQEFASLSSSSFNRFK